MSFYPHVRIYDSGIVAAAAGADVTFSISLGDGVFQILGMRLAVVQAAPKGAIPVEIRNGITESDGTSRTVNLTGGWATEMHPFALASQPTVIGPGSIVVKTVAASASDAHRLTTVWRRVT